MSIFIRDCGHSAETASRAYVKNPEVCVSCAWIAKHGPPKRSYVQRSAIEYRTKQAESMRNVWKARKGSKAFKTKNYPSITEPKMAEEK